MKKQKGNTKKSGNRKQSTAPISAPKVGEEIKATSQCKFGECRPP
jgi:hypothetical protein